MKIKQISLEGFRSFAQRQTFVFPDRAGLFLIRGENKLEPNLGANGSGKSTFWDAVCWCLYEKTARGLRAGNAESWFGGKTSVALTLEVDGTEVEIIRTRKPISLTLNGEPVEQKIIDDLVAMSYDRFLQAVLMGQFGTMFTDLRPTQRLDWMTSILDLGIWSDASKAASRMVNDYDRDLVRSSTSVEMLEREIARLRELDDATRSARDEWQAQRDAKEEALRAKIRELKDKRERIAALSREATDKLQRGLEVKEGVEKDYGAADSRLRRTREQVATLKAEFESEKRKLHDLQQRSDELADLGGTCPTCEQEIPTSHLEKALDEVDGQLDLQSNEVKKAKADLDAARDEVKRVQDHLIRHETALRDAKREVELARDMRAQHSRDEGRVTDELSLLCDRLDEVRAEKFHSALDPQKLDDLENELLEAEVAMFDASSLKDMAEDWPKLFKELRLWVVDEALDELEIHVNSSLVELGLKDWQLEFTVERETASGSISRGFEIIVRSPESPAGVPWETWSGGETQRLRIACAVGFASLIRSRMPSPPDFEVWDEPTAHLNTEGVEDLVAFMDERAEDRQVWIVDHRMLDSGHFDQTFTVTKTKNGSRIE